MLQRLIITITLIVFTTTGLIFGNQYFVNAESSPTTTDLMESAEQAYHAGQFDLATHSYQQLVDQGYSGVELFYNLGTAYLQQEDVGRAVANLRQAQKLAPRDHAINTNLELARRQVPAEPDHALSANDNLVAGFGENIRQWFSLNEIALIALFAWVSFVLLIILFTSSPKSGRLRPVFHALLLPATVFLIISVFTFGSYLYLENSQTEAVVIADDVAVYDGPGTHYTSALNLVNGQETTLLGTTGNWHHVSLPGKASPGWVPTGSLAVIN
jgi:tetratricopeptide (TPR) repeat protein